MIFNHNNDGLPGTVGSVQGVFIIFTFLDTLVSDTHRCVRGACHFRSTLITHIYGFGDIYAHVDTRVSGHEKQSEQITQHLKARVFAESPHFIHE